ncbi:MAG: hypothetical protein H6819_07900 [Phycisphaerales bacterium]|nr:hypothetical protein [Phycisphaerales bacterium]MCB9854302.1 hypothetical protein [Phycisphaerales bacterium]MCB9863503.1 hypothetical protein [Phycisphaerales bacterium]
MTTDIGQIALQNKSSGELSARLQSLYRDIDAAIADRSPVCTNRGLCCNFDAYGHDLFVTSVELAHFISGHAEAWRPPAAERRCPYQVEGKCTAREHRPMGCRVFFCDESSIDWQFAEYEKRLTELKQIGEAAGIEYRYVEWLSALSSVPLAGVRPIAEFPVSDGAVEFVDPRSLPVIESE